MGKTGSALSGEMHKIGSLIETPGLFPKMSAYQNIQLKCILCGKNDDAYIKSLLKRVGLENVNKKPVQSFSLGMKQRLGIALALVGDPEFIVLDEPINGLDPQGIAEMREIIHKLSKEDGMTVIVSSHILDELSRLATHYGILDGGRMVKELSAEELDAVCRKYTRIEVTSMPVLKRVPDAMGVTYRVFSETQADILAKVNITKLVLALAKEDCEVLALAEKEETLESFFISLTGGDSRG
jgi:ABC-2 type transport system ATP-binding protein